MSLTTIIPQAMPQQDYTKSLNCIRRLEASCRPHSSVVLVQIKSFDHGMKMHLNGAGEEEVVETSSSKSNTRSRGRGYGKPPWVFKGSALYQLHLVKAETARLFIPQDLTLVQSFGYTLGGFFLASYDDSPAGIFDELVVIAGIVWNPPTSCAWAARVLVSSDEACTHGRKEVGLPSKVASFSKSIAAIPKPKSNFGGFLNMCGMGTDFNTQANCMDIQISETKGTTAVDFCNINLLPADFGMAAPVLNSNKWVGPFVKMSLPSFSGRTEHNPQLLKYSCQIECRHEQPWKGSPHVYFSYSVVAQMPVRENKVFSELAPIMSGVIIFTRGVTRVDVDLLVRPTAPAKLSIPSELQSNTGEFIELQNSDDVTPLAVGTRDNRRNLSISLLLSKPILALQFNCLKLQVDSPVVISQKSQNL